MQNIMVIGAGTMGHGIAQDCAQAGYTVVLSDNKKEALDKALANIRWSVEKLEKKGKLKDTSQNIIKRITTDTSLGSATKAEYVIETVYEDLKIKHEVFTELDRMCPPSVILASNTSVIPITLIAEAAKHPERVVGVHFFTPVVMTALVEVIKADKTSQDAFDRSIAFARTLDKKVISVFKDVPGHVMNRILAAALKQAVDMAEQGVATVEDIDLGVNLAYGWAVGLFEGIDYAGLDTNVFVRQTLDKLGETCLVPNSNMVDRLLKQGRLGRKVGKGFYDYAPDGKKLPTSSRIL